MRDTRDQNRGYISPNDAADKNGRERKMRAPLRQSQILREKAAIDVHGNRAGRGADFLEIHGKRSFRRLNLRGPAAKGRNGMPPPSNRPAWLPSCC